MPLPANAIPVLRAGFKKLLGKPIAGSIAYVRCLPPAVALALAEDLRFDVDGWKIAAVTKETEPARRRITADLAVEWREDKADAVLLLIDVDNAGPGMDGIYSAGREIDGETLFGLCIKLAHESLPHGCKGFADAARRKARHTARNQSLSPWREFTYLCRCAAGQHVLGEALPEIGLWPIATDEQVDQQDLDKSARLVERLLPRIGSRLSPEARVAALRLPDGQAELSRALVRYLYETDRLSRLDALANLEAHQEFWINRLRPGVFEAETLQGIDWLPWRGKSGKLLSWSGLIDNADGRAEFRLSVHAEDPT